MYSFEPTEEQKMLIDTVQRYSASDLRAAAHDADEQNELPAKLVEKGWELGLLQASIPESLGGFGEYSALTGVLAAEEMAWGDLAGALAVLTPGLFALPILLAGNEEQKARYLPDIVGGAWSPYTSALIEPRFDFDPNDLSTQVKDAGEAYILNGEKVYVPYATAAEAMIVYASLEGITQGFIVPAGAQGLKIGERQPMMGIKAFPLYKVSLSDVRVQKGNRLGGPSGHEFAPIL